MSKLSLRVTGCFFLGFTLLTGILYIDKFNKIKALGEIVTIDREKSKPITFTPRLSNTHYQIALIFNKKDRNILNCSQLKDLAIK